MRPNADKHFLFLDKLPGIAMGAYQDCFFIFLVKNLQETTTFTYKRTHIIIDIANEISDTWKHFNNFLHGLGEPFRPNPL